MQAHATGMLPEQDGHKVAWYAYGNPEGIPVLFLHGGPGSGFNTGYLDLFPLEQVRLITFDQRGTGRSEPTGRLEENTTQKLLEDIERLRSMLGIQKWAVTGHSWGATLAVLYTKKFVQHCTRMSIISFFGATVADQEWSFEGIRLFFPEQQANLEALKPANDKRSLTRFLFDTLNSADEARQLEAAYRLSALSSLSCRMLPTPANRADITLKDVNKWKLLFYYSTKQFFIKQPDDLFTGLDALAKIPCTLLHGRFDMDCPPEEAYRLKTALPTLDLRMVAGNHSAFEDVMKAPATAMMREIAQA